MGLGKGLRAHTSNLRLRLASDSSGAKAEPDPASDSSKFASFRGFLGV